MKILHTADWHLGRQFHGLSLEEDHQFILNQVLNAIEIHSPDVLIIAGDIFDRAAPPASAVRQFNDFIHSFANNSNSAIVLIAGNHDSGDRIGAMGTLAIQDRVLIRGPLSTDEKPLIMEDKHGIVAFSALPFGNEFSARLCYEDNNISCPADVLAAQVAAARKHVPKDARWVITAHAFVTGSKISDSERSLQVGGIETVSSSVFDGADYVALGHLHRSQRAGAENIRYSGSPLAFGFDEADLEKSMTLVELGANCIKSCDLIPFNPLRGIQTIRGSMDELISKAKKHPSNDFIKLILTDKGDILDPMGKIRDYYPNVLSITYDKNMDHDPDKIKGSTDADLNNPIAVINDFLNHVRGEAPDDIESAIIKSLLNEITAKEFM